tara:strand:+ start:2367 stop:2627 length:261 start_codon:yes stop_codon:yes gene_type:complete
MLNAEGFEDAIIGVAISTKQPVIVYDYEKCIEIIMGWDGIENDMEAMEYFQFNIVGANYADKTPIYIRKHDSVKDIEDYDYEEDED